MAQGFATTNNTSLPTGAVQMYAGSTAPSGWLLCDGSAISRATYASLFSVCGTTYGAGDSSTTFNLPDLRGACPAGVGTSTGYTANETVALGTKYDDYFQGHFHNIKYYGSAVASVAMQNDGTSGNGKIQNGAGTDIGQDFSISSALTDGNNGTPRSNSPVTKGKTVGINFIIKY